MEKQEYEVMYNVEDTYWWYVGMRRVMSAMLDGHYFGRTDLRILDAGCGTGAMLEHLGRRGHVTGVDLADEAIGFCRRRGFGPNQVMRASLTALPFESGTFDLVTSFDVICCIADDDSAFAELYRVLADGGRGMVSLPAFELLRSEHDLAVHIKHRYTASTLRGKMERVGFRIESLSYANTFLFPAAVAYRLWKRMTLDSSREPRSDLSPLPPWLNAALTRVLFLEAGALPHFDFPFGLSVLCLARKEARAVGKGSHA